MEFWHNRYTVPGWVFVAAFILLSRVVPFPVPAELARKDLWALALTFSGFVAGIPLGYLINALFDFVYHRCIGGTGRFVSHSRIRSGLEQLCEKLLASNVTPASRSNCARLQMILENPGRFPDRALYSLVWQSRASDTFRTMCHRRWETFYVSCDSILALVLASVLSYVYALIWDVQGQYWCYNGFMLVGVLMLCLLLLHNAILFARQAASQENLWIELFLVSLEDKTDLLPELLPAK